MVDNSQQSQKQVSKSGEDKNKGLVAAVIFLAMLLLILVITLIIVGVLYQQEGTVTLAASCLPKTLRKQPFMRYSFFNWCIELYKVLVMNSWLQLYRINISQ